MLTFRDITIRLGGRVLLDHAGAQIPAGHRVGIVGRNGTGKTTLLHAILGEVPLESGEITIGGKPRVGWVHQEAPGGAESPLEVVLAALTERAALLAEAETADGARLADIHERLRSIGADSAPARAARILAGLGFDAEAQARPMSSFSGGWRMRVALAAVLTAEPELLLLDEPTNHLDFEASAWLESFLARYPHTLLLISHDRVLLNRCVDHILHLQGGKLTLWRGGYDQFERQRREKQALQTALRERQEAQRKHLQSFVDRFRYKASKARQAQSRLKMIARLEPIAEAVDDPSVTFRFPEPEELAPPLLTLDRVAVGYTPGRPVLRGLDLRLDPDDRIALLGANGNGKSTLAKLLAGRLAPEAGEVFRAARLKAGFFAQHQIEDLRPEETPHQHLAAVMPQARPDQVRARLGGFGLTQERAETRVRHLSGGEKARLTLALVTHAAPNLLILDEPTNHLDIDAREALVHALAGYPGAVVLVSHDPHLVSLVADRLILVAGGTARPFDGDVDDYRDLVLSQGKAKDKERDRLAATAAAAKPRPALAPGDLPAVRKAAREAEKVLEALNRERATIDRKLADPRAFQGGEGAALSRRRQALDQEIAAAEGRWLELADALEQVGARV
ncbi:MAG: ABC-F family ATP-binding cassette domain-containing protein [Thalassobaculales bacterium]